MTDHAALEERTLPLGVMDAWMSRSLTRGLDSGPFVIDGWASERGIQCAPSRLLRTNAGTRSSTSISTACLQRHGAAARHMRPAQVRTHSHHDIIGRGKCEAVIGAAYMASKAGAAHFMRNVALELAADNITVNAIAPGFFVTNIGGGHAHNPRHAKARKQHVPMRRVGFPADMAGLTLFLGSRRRPM